MIELLIVLVVVVIIVSVLWQAFGVGALLASRSPTTRLLVALLGLLIILAVLWWFAQRFGLLGAL